MAVVNVSSYKPIIQKTLSLGWCIRLILQKSIFWMPLRVVVVGMRKSKFVYTVMTNHMLICTSFFPILLRFICADVLHPTYRMCIKLFLFYVYMSNDCANENSIFGT